MSAQSAWTNHFPRQFTICGGAFQIKTHPTDMNHFEIGLFVFYAITSCFLEKVANWFTVISQIFSIRNNLFGRLFLFVLACSFNISWESVSHFERNLYNKYINHLITKNVPESLHQTEKHWEHLDKTYPGYLEYPTNAHIFGRFKFFHLPKLFISHS